MFMIVLPAFSVIYAFILYIQKYAKYVLQQHGLPDLFNLSRQSRKHAETSFILL